MDTSTATRDAKGGLGVVKRTVATMGKHNLGIVSAGVGFYAFLALVPLLGALVMAYGLFADPADVARQVHSLASTIPDDAARIIQDQLASITKTAAGKKGLGLGVALILALYGGMQGAKAIITALNIVHGEEETRGFIKLNLVAFVMTLGGVLIGIVVLLSGTVTGFLEDFAGNIAPVLATVVKAGSWVATAALATLAIAALYRYAPCRAEAKWAWITPGSAVALVGFIAATLLFGLYAAKFGNYNKTYGALGAIVVLLTWLYLSAYVLLFGASLNAELDRAKGPKPAG